MLRVKLRMSIGQKCKGDSPRPQ